MSLEAAIEQNTAAVKELTAIMKTVVEGQKTNLEAIQQLQASGGTKPAKPAAKSTAKEKAPPKEKAPTKPKEVDYTTEDGLAALKKLCMEYMAVDDEAEREDRAKRFEKCLNKLGAPKLGAVEPGDRAQLATWVKTLAAGEDLPELDEEESSGDSLLD